MSFLLANSLIDEINKSKNWEKINQTDTIGRYYRIENSDNYLLCLPYSIESFNSVYLIMQITSQGDLVKSEKFNFGTYNKWNHYYKNFRKDDVFFEIITEGGSFLCGRVGMYLFKELIPQDSMRYIPLSEFSIRHRKSRFAKEKIIKRFYSTRTLDKNKLIIKYELNRGKIKIDKKGDHIFHYRRAKRNINVEYFYEKGKWHTSDTSKLKKIEQCLY